MSPPRSIALHGALCLGLMLLAALLRGWGIAAESMWFDEAITFEPLRAPTLATFLGALRENNAPVSPFYFVVLYYWYKIHPDSEVWARMLSILISSLSTGLLFLLGARLFNRNAGITAALLHAIVIQFVYYGQEMRMYALTCLIALVSLATFFRALDARRRENDLPLLWFAATAGANALLVQTHLIGALLAVGQGIALLAVIPRDFRRILGFAALHVVAMLPGVLWLLRLDMGEVDEGTSWIAPMNLNDALSSLAFLRAWLPLRFHLLPPPLELACSFVILLFWIGAVSWAYGMRRREEVFAERVTALYICAIAPITLIVIVSALARPMLLDRYCLFAAMPWLLLVGGLASRIPRRAMRITAILFLCGVAFSSYWTRTWPQRPCGREAAAALPAYKDKAAKWIVYGWETRTLKWYLDPQYRDRLRSMYDPAEMHNYLEARAARGESALVLATRYYEGSADVLLNSPLPLEVVAEWPSHLSPYTLYYLPPREVNESSTPGRTPRKIGSSGAAETQEGAE